MKLSQCTKAELIWVIEQAEKLSLGDIHYWLDRALDDLKYKREMERIDKAKKLCEIANKAAQEYVELLKPYEGKKITDIPLDILKKADSALKRSRKANEMWAKLMSFEVTK